VFQTKFNHDGSSTSIKQGLLLRVILKILDLIMLILLIKTRLLIFEEYPYGTLTPSKHLKKLIFSDFDKG